MKKYIFISMSLLIFLFILSNIASLLGKIIPAKESEIVGQYNLSKFCIPDNCYKYSLLIKKDEARGICFGKKGNIVYTKNVPLVLQGSSVKLNIFNNDFFDFPYFQSIYRGLNGKVKIPYMINGHCEIEQQYYLIRQKRL